MFAGAASPLLVLVVGIVAMVAFAVAVLALRLLAGVRRSARVLGRGGRRGESFVEASNRHSDETAALRAEVATLRAEVAGWRDVLAGERTALAGQLGDARGRLDSAAATLAEHADQALRRVAVVRFDAFPDLGGRLSFSVALLDGTGSGVTLTSIAGRAETRVYAKPVVAGAGTDLTPEERQAITAALRSGR